MRSVDEPYDPRVFPPVAVTVDVVLQTIQHGDLYVLLVRRGQAPYQGDWALPGGFVQPDEDLSVAAARELEEETGIAANQVHLEQLASYGSPDRDPRMRVITVAYWAICSNVSRPRAGSDARVAELVPVGKIEAGGIELAFDHARIVKDALERTRSKLEYTALGAKFCEPDFTISDLRRVYEIVWQTKLDPGNFQRNVRACGAFKTVGGMRTVVSAMETPMLRGAPVGDDDHILEAALFMDHSSEGSNSAVEAAPRMLADASGGRPASLWRLKDEAEKTVLRTPIARRTRRSTSRE